MKLSFVTGAWRLLVIPALLIACSKPSSSSSGGVDAQAAPVPVPAAADATVAVPVPVSVDAAVAAPAPAPDASIAPAPAPAPAPTPAPGHMALIVSFYSPGNGTDHEAYERLEAIIRDTKPQPARTRRAWGKEGEHDECFTLSELAPKARGEFIARVRREVGNSKRVNIMLDEPCREGR